MLHRLSLENFLGFSKAILFRLSRKKSRQDQTPLGTLDTCERISPVMTQINLRTIVGLLGALFLFFTGCRPTHNQTVIPKEWQSYFNAAPVNNNYVEDFFGTRGLYRPPL